MHVLLNELLIGTPTYMIFPGANVGYSAMLMHCAQTMFVTGEEVFPIERTLVATGVNCAGA